jgi:hypothetical protein
VLYVSTRRATYAYRTKVFGWDGECVSRLVSSCRPIGSHAFASELARISFAELARRVSLSTPAVIERVKRLEEGGVIVGYYAHIKPSAVGRSVEAFIKVSVAGDKLLRFAQTVKKIGEVLQGNSV